MKVEHKVIAYTVILGLFIWLIDALLDYLFFYEESFWGLLVSDVPHSEVYVRSIVIACFLIFGILIARLFAERKRKALEEIWRRYEFIVNTSKEFMTLIDRSYTYEAVNESYCRAHNKKREEIIGRTVADIWGKEVFDSVIKAHSDKCFAGNEVRDQAQFEFPALGLRYFDVTYYPYSSQEGTVTHAVVVSHDITERKQAEEARKKEVLLREIHHRVKNNLQVISSLLNLQSRYIKDKQALEMFKDCRNRIRSMALIHDKLHQSQDLEGINFAGYIRDLAVNLFRSYGVDLQRIKLKVEVDDVLLGVDTAVPCGLIINELVSNSLKHAFPAGKKGEIRIGLHPDRDNKLILIVSDNGVGLPEGLDFQNSESLGLQLVNNLVNQLEGTIEFNSSCGTEVKIKLKELRYKERG